MSSLPCRSHTSLLQCILSWLLHAGQLFAVRGHHLLQSTLTKQKKVGWSGFSQGRTVGWKVRQLLGRALRAPALATRHRRVHQWGCQDKRSPRTRPTQRHVKCYVNVITHAFCVPNAHAKQRKAHILQHSVENRVPHHHASHHSYHWNSHVTPGPAGPVSWLAL